MGLTVLAYYMQTASFVKQFNPQYQFFKVDIPPTHTARILDLLVITPSPAAR